MSELQDTAVKFEEFGDQEYVLLKSAEAKISELTEALLDVVRVNGYDGTTEKTHRTLQKLKP